MEPLLSVRDLSKHFKVRGSGFGRSVVRAVDGVDFDIAHGETLGLVGESGSGKSTVANLLVGLERPTAGSIRFRDTEVSGVRGRARRNWLKNIQMVFQDPYGSFAPMSTLGKSVAEPLVAHGYEEDHVARVEELLRLVGLDSDFMGRYPAECSGGQLQRVSIARALALSPALVVLDEAVSALDVSTKAQIINLLADLQERLGVAFLFITHDLATLRYLSDRVAVMYRGEIVEVGTTDELYANPTHPYTQALLEAVPVADPSVKDRSPGHVGSLLRSAPEGQTGCRYYERCPIAEPECATLVQDLQTLRGDHVVRCSVVGRKPDAPLSAL